MLTGIPVSFISLVFKAFLFAVFSILVAITVNCYHFAIVFAIYLFYCDIVLKVQHKKIEKLKNTKIKS